MSKYKCPNLIVLNRYISSLKISTMMDCWRTMFVKKTSESKNCNINNLYLDDVFKVLQVMVMCHSVVSLLWYKQYQNKDLGISSAKIHVRGVNTSQVREGTPNQLKYTQHQKSSNEVTGRGAHCTEYGLCDGLRESSHVFNMSTRGDRWVVSFISWYSQGKI